mgnify:CR=1 FL=1
MHQPVVAVLADEPCQLAKARHPQVVQRNRTPHPQHAVDVEEVDQRRVEEVSSVDEGEVELGLGTGQLGQPVLRYLDVGLDNVVEPGPIEW